MMQALTISVTTPSASHGASIKVKTPQLTKKYAYDYGLNRDGNIEAAVDQFLTEMGWSNVYVIGEVGDGLYTAVMVDRKWIKARDAVLATRVAIREGDLAGNPHAKKWAQQITDLTDGVALKGRESFSLEYVEGAV